MKDIENIFIHIVTWDLSNCSMVIYSYLNSRQLQLITIMLQVFVIRALTLGGLYSLTSNKKKNPFTTFCSWIMLRVHANLEQHGYIFIYFLAESIWLYVHLACRGGFNVNTLTRGLSLYCLHRDNLKWVSKDMRRAKAKDKQTPFVL